MILVMIALIVDKHGAGEFESPFAKHTPLSLSGHIHTKWLKSCPQFKYQFSHKYTESLLFFQP